MISARSYVHQLRKLASSSSSPTAIKEFLQSTKIEPQIQNESSASLDEETIRKKKLEAPPPPSFINKKPNKEQQEQKVEQWGNFQQQQQRQQATPIPPIEIPPPPPLPLSDAMFILETAIDIQTCNEVVLHCVEIVSNEVLQGRVMSSSSSNNNNNKNNIINSNEQLEYILSVGNTLIAAWNLVNEHLIVTTNTTTSINIEGGTSSEHHNHQRFLIALRDSVFVKEKKAFLMIFSAVCSSSFQLLHHQQSSSSSKPKSIHHFIADVISNDALLDFHGRRNIREILFFNAGNNMTMMDMFNLYKVVIETKTGACGFLKEQLYRLARDGWYRGFNSTTSSQQQGSTSKDFGGGGNTDMSTSIGTGSGKLIHGKLIQPKQMNDEIIKIASQIAMHGCDTRPAAFAAPPTTTTTMTTASSPSSSSTPSNNSNESSNNQQQQEHSSAASNKNANQQQHDTIHSSSSSSSSSSSGMCCGHPVINDVVSSIASVGLEYFKTRYMNNGLRKEVPMVVFQSTERGGERQTKAINNDEDNQQQQQQTQQKQPQQQQPVKKIRNLRSSSSSSSSPKLSDTITPEKQLTMTLNNINNLSKKEVQLALELQEDPLFVVSLCILAGYSNNWEEFSDEMLRYISKQTTTFLKSILINDSSSSTNKMNENNNKKKTFHFSNENTSLQHQQQSDYFRRTFSPYFDSPQSICLALLGSPLISISDQELFVENIMISSEGQKKTGEETSVVPPLATTLPLHRVLHLLRSQACQCSPVITEFVLGTLLSNSIDAEMVKKYSSSSLSSLSSLEQSQLQFNFYVLTQIARHLQPYEMMGLGPSVSALSSLLSSSSSTLMKVLSYLESYLSVVNDDDNSNNNANITSPLEAAEEWLNVLRSCQVALRKEFYDNLVDSEVITKFCSSVAYRRTGDSSLLLVPSSSEQPPPPQQQNDKDLQSIEKIRTLLLTYDVVRELSHFVPDTNDQQLLHLSTALSDSFIDHLSNRTGGDAAHALHVLGAALKFKNIGCLLSKDTWSNVADYFLLSDDPNNNIIDNVIQQDYLAYFAEVCSTVLRENSIEVVTRIAEKVFLAERAPPSPEVLEQQLEMIRQKHSSSSNNNGQQPLSRQQLINIHHQETVRRRSQYQLRAAPRIFKALTSFGEWNSRLISPIVQLIHRLADPVVDSTVFVEVIGAATLKVDDTEVRRRSVESLTTKCLESMLKDETVERYATDDVFIKLLKVVMQAVTSRHSKLVNELTDRITALPTNSLMEVLKASRFDVHLEKACRKVMVQSSERLVLMTSSAASSSKNSPISFQQICSANSTAFVPTMVNWAQVAPTEIEVAENNHHEKGADEEIFDVDEDDDHNHHEEEPMMLTRTTTIKLDGVGKALSKIIRSGDLFSSSSSSPQHQSMNQSRKQQQQQQIFIPPNSRTAKVSSNHSNLDINHAVALLRKFDIDGNCIDQDLTDQFLRIVIARAESPSFNIRRVLSVLTNLMFCQRSVPVEALLAMYRPLIQDRRVSERKLFATQIISNWCFMVRLRFGSATVFGSSSSSSSGTSSSTNTISGEQQPLAPQTRDRVRRMTLEMMESLCPFLLLDSAFMKSSEDISFCIANLLHTLAVLFIDERLVQTNTTNNTHHSSFLFPTKDDQLFDFDFSTLPPLPKNSNSSNNSVLLPPRLQHWISKLCGSAVARFRIEQSLRTRHVLLKNSIDKSDEYLERLSYLMMRVASTRQENHQESSALVSTSSISSSSTSSWSSWLHDVDSVNAILNNPNKFFVKYIDDYAQMKRLVFAAKWLEYVLDQQSDDDGEFKEKNPEIVDFVNTFL